jgi:hypothetical protein
VADVERISARVLSAAWRSKTGRGQVAAPIFLLVPQVKLTVAAALARDAERAREARVDPHRAVRGAGDLLGPHGVALLSSHCEPAPDRPSTGWLGHHSGSEWVRRSGLWNNNHVDESCSADFLNLLANIVRRLPAA